VIPAQFDYVRPTTVDEAVQALRDGGDDAKLLAGGQSLLPVLRLRMADPSLIIDLGGIPELKGVREEGNEVVVGAMTSHYDVTRDDTLRQHVALIQEATKTVADPQVRHRGTLGGALAHADPAGDLAAPALALEAQFVIAGQNGTRTVAAADFFEDYFTTAIGEGELLSCGHDARSPAAAARSRQRSGTTAPRARGCRAAPCRRSRRSRHATSRRPRVRRRSR